MLRFQQPRPERRWIYWCICRRTTNTCTIMQFLYVFGWHSYMRSDCSWPTWWRHTQAFVMPGQIDAIKVYRIAKSDEVSNTQLKNIDQATTEDVHKVETTSGDKDKRKRTGRQHANRKPDNDRVFSKDKPCVFCGRKHQKGRTNCAAWGHVCRVCGKKNHFASQCSAREKTHNVEVEDMSLVGKNSCTV